MNSVDDLWARFVARYYDLLTARRDLMASDFDVPVADSLRTGQTADVALRFLAFLPPDHAMNHVADVLAAAARPPTQSAAAAVLRRIDQSWLAEYLDQWAAPDLPGPDLARLSEVLASIGQQPAAAKLRERSASR